MSAHKCHECTYNRGNECHCKAPAPESHRTGFDIHWPQVDPEAEACGDFRHGAVDPAPDPPEEP